MSWKGHEIDVVQILNGCSWCWSDSRRLEVRLKLVRVWMRAECIWRRRGWTDSICLEVTLTTDWILCNRKQRLGSSGCCTPRSYCYTSGWVVSVCFWKPRDSPPGCVLERIDVTWMPGWILKVPMRSWRLLASERPRALLAWSHRTLTFLWSPNNTTKCCFVALFKRGVVATEIKKQLL